MTIRVIGGDFRHGRAAYDDIGFTVVNAGDLIEPIPFGAVLAIHALGSERRTTTMDRLLGVAGGGILGGVAAGALAGGLTGPAGAALGAAAGAVLAVRRKFITCRIDLRDGRMLVATARADVWDALRVCVDRAPIVEPKQPSTASLELAARPRPSRVFDRLRWKKT